MPAPDAPDLTLRLTCPRYNLLSHLLYASSHGGPIRTLPLILESGTRFYELQIPCLCLYDRASNPTLTTAAMTREEWGMLCTFAEEAGLLKVVLSPDGGETDILGRLTARRKEELDQDNKSVRFRWQEKEKKYGEVGARVKRGLEWVKERVGS